MSYTPAFFERVQDVDDPFGRLNVRIIFTLLIGTLLLVLSTITIVVFANKQHEAHMNKSNVSQDDLGFFLLSLSFIISSVASVVIVSSYASSNEEMYERRAMSGDFAKDVEISYRIYISCVIVVYILEIARQSALLTPGLVAIEDINIWLLFSEIMITAVSGIRMYVAFRYWSLYCEDKQRSMGSFAKTTLFFCLSLGGDLISLWGVVALINK